MCFLWFTISTSAHDLSLHSGVFQGFPNRMVHLYYISCLRYTILVGEPSICPVVERFFCLVICQSILLSVSFAAVSLSVILWLFESCVWGRNRSAGSVFGSLSCVVWASGRGDFFPGVNMVSDSIPPKTLSDESINQGLVCAHMHSSTQTQKILTFIF